MLLSECEDQGRDFSLKTEGLFWLMSMPVTAEPCRVGRCANSWLHKTCNAVCTRGCEYTQHQASCYSCKHKGLN